LTFLTLIGFCLSGRFGREAFVLPKLAVGTLGSHHEISTI
jgi:hypothetical protein